MTLIAHRRNTKSALEATPVRYGVEVDLRSAGEGLVLQHDPFEGGEDFSDWLDAYRHGTLILNVKEDGLEERVTALLRARGIENYFFLDQPFPSLLQCARAGERRCAVRVSEFESIETALALAGLIDWVWVDCFTRFPLTHEDARRLKRAGFRLCLVSPELQRHDPATGIPAVAHQLAERRIPPDAVCTKHPELWGRAGYGT